MIISGPQGNLVYSTPTNILPKTAYVEISIFMLVSGFTSKRKHKNMVRLVHDSVA